jgi:hypothetical protein
MDRKAPGVQLSRLGARRFFVRVIRMHDLFSVTLTAAALTSIQVRAACCVLVAVLAMGSALPYGSRSFASDFRPESGFDSSLNIHGSGHRLYVPWIDATSRSAYVVQIQAVGNGANEEFVSDSMRGSAFLAVVPQLAVAVSCEYSHPKPAPAIWLRGYVAQKSLQCRRASKLVLSHSISSVDQWSGPGDARNVNSARFHFSRNLGGSA